MGLLLQNNKSVDLMKYRDLVHMRSGGAATVRVSGRCDSPCRTPFDTPAHFCVQFHYMLTFSPSLFPGYSSPQAERVALPDLDLVLLSYEQMRKELSNPKVSLLTRFGFWRIMLDEVRKVASAHVNTVTPRSCCVASP